MPTSTTQGSFFFTTSFSSVQFSSSIVSNSLRPRGLQHTRPPCPSQTPRVHSNFTSIESVMSSNHLILIVIPFSSRLQSFPPSGSFPTSWLFASGGQSIRVSALVSFLPTKSQGWSPSEWTCWISLQSKGLSRVFTNTTVQKHQFFGAQPSSHRNEILSLDKGESGTRIH